MLENISLIKEVHEHLATKYAQKQAREALAKIDLERISLHRVNMCNAYEVFCVSLIRAMMSDDKNVIIVSPINLLDNLSSINDLISIIKKLDINKEVVILDTLSNEAHYKEVSCTIIK
ncbi:hypothetical protein M947_07315 [Sulfurimonas hongkongensis]|uniref:Uncharacterized protein n=2 Tax=Sulfurimonas hongkongensis TaxID=1172190 RepID=T0JE40_9BACT|nr:hypothetical protein M947_07315 [Sulfurimonas hongkongensis]